MPDGTGTPSIANLSGSIHHFSSNLATEAAVVDGSFDVHGLIFNSGPTRVDTNPNSLDSKLTLGTGGIVHDSSFNTVLQVPIEVNTPEQTWFVNRGAINLRENFAIGGDVRFAMGVSAEIDFGGETSVIGNGVPKLSFVGDVAPLRLRGQNPSFTGEWDFANTLVFVESADALGSGEVTIRSPMWFDISDGITLNNSIVLADNQNPGSQGRVNLTVRENRTATITGPISFENGTTWEYGGFEKQGQGRLILDNSFSVDRAPPFSQPTHNAPGFRVFEGDVTVLQQINGDVRTVTPFESNSPGTLNGPGVINGSVENFGVLAGNLTVTGDVTTFYTGALLGQPRIQGDLVSYGAIRPGNSPATLNIEGDLTVTQFGSPFANRPVLEIEIAGLTPGTEHDEVVVGGTSRFDRAIIEFPLVDGFVPENGDRLTFLQSGSVLGDNDTFSPVFPNLPDDLAARVIVNPTSMEVEFTTKESIEFIDPAADSIWDTSQAWSSQVDPTSVNVVSIGNETPDNRPQTVTVNQNAQTHSLEITDSEIPVTVTVDEINLTAAAPSGFMIGQNGEIELVSPGVEERDLLGKLVTAKQVAVEGGRLSGTGEIAGPLGSESGVDVVLLKVGTVGMGGTLSPGNDADDTGRIHVRGDLEYSSSALTEIDIGGSSLGEFDLVSLEGEMSLAGELALDVSDFATPMVTNGSYSPTEIDVLVAEDWDGSRFDRLTKADNGGGLAVTVVYPDDQQFVPAGPNDGSFTVTVRLGHLGDLNRDLRLDDEDIQLMAAALKGQTDLNGDGIQDVSLSELTSFADIGGGDSSGRSLSCPTNGNNGFYGVGDGFVDFDDVPAFAFMMECNTSFTADQVMSAFVAVPEPKGSYQLLVCLVAFLLRRATTRRKVTDFDVLFASREPDN